jgi:very-short-patch-repair endonuclease
MTADIKKAKALRRNATEAEKHFWRKVRDRQQGYKFYRQTPIEGYIADFFCPELKLVVEIDGGQHNGSTADEIRTRTLNGAGYEVVRFWNNEVLGNIEGVFIRLQEILEARKIEMGKPWI